MSFVTHRAVEMLTYRGSCHCQRVTFEIDAVIDGLIDCNCSVCRKKGILHIPVNDKYFRLLSGESELGLYRFGSGDASHWFCRHCGIHPFGRPRNDPSRYTVNARCLDDFEQIVESVPRRSFDGRNHPKDVSVD